MTVERKGDAGDEPVGKAITFMNHQRDTITQDFFTWANMEVLNPPNFAPEEGKHYAALRRWAWQFYPDLVRPQRVTPKARGSDTRRD